MPAVGPSSSRSGLITTVAVMTILFAASSVCAIYYGTLASKTQDQLDQLKKNALSMGDPTSPDVHDLQNDTTYGGAGFSAITTAVNQRKALIMKITGQDDPTVSVKSASDAADATIAAARKVAGDQVPGNLVAALSALTTAVKNDDARVDDQKQQFEQLTKQSKDQIAAMQSQLDAKDKQVADLQAATAKATDDATASLKAKDVQTDEIMKNMDQERQQNKDYIKRLSDVITDAAAKYKEIQTQYAAAVAKLDSHRINPGSIVHPAGRIIRSPLDGVVYIDLGEGDQITPGMTFEVFDKNQPLPKLPDTAGGDDAALVGKGSIEVTKVSGSESECRVVKTTPGMQITAGDRLVNIVYDRNTKYNFVVYGDFDINNTGKSSPQDADIIKRLITQWGGQVDKDISVKTDFIVLGDEPKVPDFSKDDLADPFNAKKQADALDAQKSYQDQVDKAIALHIHPLNQNAFLYMVGYYDVNKR